MVGLDVAVLQDRQGREKLALVIGGLVAVATQCGEGLHDRAIAKILAEIRFDTPERDEDVSIDPEASLDAAERVGVAVEHGLAVVDPLLVDEPRHIVPDRRRELGLLVLEMQHVVGLEAARRGIEGLGRHAMRRSEPIATIEDRLGSRKPPTR